MSLPPQAPPVRFCPYCGAASVKHVAAVPRCMSCRAVFFVNFSRHTRRSPSAAIRAKFCKSD